MNLFSSEIDYTENILPSDGMVNYFGKLFTHKEADNYLECFLNTIEWKNDEAIIFGKRIIIKRKVSSLKLNHKPLPVKENDTINDNFINFNLISFYLLKLTFHNSHNNLIGM